MSLAEDLRAQGAKLLKAAEIVESDFDPKVWTPVPDNAVVMTYEHFLNLVHQNTESKKDGTLSMNLDAISHELFGRIIDPDQWQYKRHDKNVEVLNSIQRPGKH